MIKIGVVGYGYWGPNLVRNFSSTENAQVTYICDKSKERLDLAKKDYPNIKTTLNFNKVINDKEVDAIVITTPPITHFKLAKKALEKGKHILISKPITTKRSDAEKLVKLAEEKNKVVLTDSTFLYTSAINKIKEIISSGELGDIHFINSRRLNFGLFQPGSTNVVWDLSPHDVAIALYLINKPIVSVQSIGYPHIFKDVEDNAYVFLKFKDNIIVHIHNNWLSPIKARDMLIVGSKKMLSYDMTHEKELQMYNKFIEVKKYPLETVRDIIYNDGMPVHIETDKKEALKAECEHFIDCILNNKDPISNGRHGLEVVRILEAAQKSIKKNGKEIFL